MYLRYVMSETVFEPENTMQASVELNDRAVRQRTLKKGVVSYGDGYLTVECLVRDMSNGGAKLKLVNGVPVPNRFQLLVPSDGISVDCEVRWRESNQLGITFVGDITVGPQSNRQIVAPS